MKCKKCNNGELRRFTRFDNYLFVCDNPKCLAGFRLLGNEDGYTATLKFDKESTRAGINSLGKSNFSQYIKAQEGIAKDLESRITIDLSCDCICCRNRK